MSRYKKHLFFCTNLRAEGRASCENHQASSVCAYAKTKLKSLGVTDVRVSKSGCLGQCRLGPSLVIYPDGVWYCYRDEADIDRIIEEHILKDKPVEALFMTGG